MSVVGVRNRPSGRLCYLDDGGHDLLVNDRVFVEFIGEPGKCVEAFVAVTSDKLIFSELEDVQGTVVSVVSIDDS
jgi:hypothetical protein